MTAIQKILNLLESEGVVENANDTVHNHDSGNSPKRKARHMDAFPGSTGARLGLF